MSSTIDEPLIENLEAELNPFDQDAERKRLAALDALLETRSFNPEIEPPPLKAIYSLGGAIICTPGNLTAITSAAKTGKSSVITAMIASTMTQDPEADLLGFSSSNPDGLALLQFDSEQAVRDHWDLMKQSLRRADLTRKPEWLSAHWLSGESQFRVWECINRKLQTASEKHGGIHSVFIDGVGDLVADVNDAAESNAMVTALHALAIKYRCPIISVIHFNPGSEKSRGHLGSQLERKSETNLRLDKTDGVTCIWSDKQRRAPIPKGSGPSFQWSEAAGMHVSVESRQSVADQEKREALAALADDIFRKRPAMGWADMICTFTKKLKLSQSTAERRVRDLSRFGIIRKSVAGLWTKAKA